jgi:transposase
LFGDRAINRIFYASVDHFRGVDFVYPPRTRQLLVRQRTMLSNALRGHLAEQGIVSAKGRNGTAELLRIITGGADSRVSTAVRGILEMLARQYGAIGAEIASIDKSIMALHRGCEASRRLLEIPGVGPPPRQKRRARQHIPPRRQLTP